MQNFNEEQKSQLQGNNIKQIESSFGCIICLEIAQEPVITTCGHLFCWPCIYNWLNSNQEFLTCPVCKNGISLKSIIPIYTKGEDDEDQQINEKKEKPYRDSNIPPRPQPERQKPQRNQNSYGNGLTSPHYNNLQSGTMLAGYGLFPSIYNLINIVDEDFKNTNQNEINISEDLNYLKYYRLALLIMVLVFLIVFLIYI